jgi:hypothetical protein
VRHWDIHAAILMEMTPFKWIFYREKAKIQHIYIYTNRGVTVRKQVTASIQTSDSCGCMACSCS